MVPATFLENMQIKKVRVEKKSRKLTVVVSSFSSNAQKLSEFQSFLEESFPSLKEIKIVVESPSLSTVEEVLENWEKVVLELSEEYPSSLSFLKTCEIGRAHV